MILATFKLEQIKEVIIYIQKHGQTREALYTLAEPFKQVNNQIGFDWKTPPDVGVYTLTAELKLKDGNVVNGGEMVVDVK